MLVSQHQLFDSANRSFFDILTILQSYCRKRPFRYIGGGEEDW